MTNKVELEAAVQQARIELHTAESALAEFMSYAENNVFATLDEASYKIEDRLMSMSADDCAGADNCGHPKYTQEFMVDGLVFVATLDCEYNRHDKTYYYLDYYKFSIASK